MSPMPSLVEIMLTKIILRRASRLFRWYTLCKCLSFIVGKCHIPTSNFFGVLAHLRVLYFRRR